VILVSQGSTAHALAERDWVFRFVPDDVDETRAAGALIAHDGVTGVVPVWRDDAGNAGLASSIRTAVGASGGVVADGVSYASDNPDFSAAVASLSTQVAAMTATNGADKTGVYLAGFDEVVELLTRAAADPVLSSVRWYGSDGVALTPALVADQAASAFAAKVGYPNPTLGLDQAAVRRSARLRSRIERRLGRESDAFTLAAYDGLRVAVEASVAAGPASSSVRLRRSFVASADGYTGMSGVIELNTAGDRAFGSWDFFSVCRAGSRYEWIRTWSFLAPQREDGTLVKRATCSSKRQSTLSWTKHNRSSRAKV
jgi:branched-chain amino acid transport system substrate-binding protein